MKLFGFILLLTLSISVIAQNAKGKQFPALTGESFAGKTVNLPTDTKGKVTVIGVCFSKAAEDDLKTWLNLMYNMFVVKKTLLIFLVQQ